MIVNDRVNKVKTRSYIKFCANPLLRVTLKPNKQPSHLNDGIEIKLSLLINVFCSNAYEKPYYEKNNH